MFKNHDDRLIECDAFSKDTYQTLITHDGKFHSDEVFAVAIIKLWLGEEIPCIRTRDPKTIKEHMASITSFVIDVGGDYAPIVGNYDHHQNGMDLERSSGIKYSSAGLVWLIFGQLAVREFLCFKTENPVDPKMVDQILSEVHKEIDGTIISPIDARDNGQHLWVDDSMLYGVVPVTLQDCIADFNRSDPVENDRQFLKAVDLALEVLKNAITRISGRLLGELDVETWLEDPSLYPEPEIFVMPEFRPWQKIVITNPVIRFVIFPTQQGDGFNIQAVPKTLSSFELKCRLREDLGGLPVEELKKISGIPDIVFVHKAGFIGGCESIDGCVQLARLSMSEK